jgi:hypothetical protein
MTDINERIRGRMPDDYWVAPSLYQDRGEVADRVHLTKQQLVDGVSVSFTNWVDIASYVLLWDAPIGGNLIAYQQVTMTDGDTLVLAPGFPWLS